MPYAIFIHYGFAIHGTNDISRLGGPGSHGCVRLHPSHAAALFVLVQRSGPRNTRIEIYAVACKGLRTSPNDAAAARQRTPASRNAGM